MSEFDTNAELRAQVESAPHDPGVYRFLDEEGRVLYVGKAKSLRRRVRSYFREGGDGRFLIDHLKLAIRSVDFIVTSTEKEALLLENTLIKRHRPAFNIDFRDDKSFVSLRIDPDSTIPRLSVVRKPRDDGAFYFGPYSSSSGVRATVKFIAKHFGVRPCSDAFYKAHSKRPCLKYQIGRCRAPCCGHISEEDHRQLAREVVLFLQGKSRELVRDVERRMKRAAEDLDFERAAVLRDQVQAIRKTIEGQTVTRTLAGSLDVVGFTLVDGRVEIVVLFVRQGSLVSSRSVSFRTELLPEEVIGSFLSQYYGGGNQIPDSVVVPVDLPDGDVLVEVLSEKRGKHVSVIRPQRGEKRRLLELAVRNAVASHQTRISVEKKTSRTLETLGRILGLDHEPKRIECFDISTWMGRETVGSMVVLQDGRAERSEYRRFKIRGVDGQDDFTAMAEVIRRRYTRALEEKTPLPDLVVVDGGRGQVGAAVGVFVELGIGDRVGLIGLAKARSVSGRPEPMRTLERIFLPGSGKALVLPQDGDENRLLVRLRDEAHRFAITYHRRLRSRSQVRSDLDAIPGIGPERKRQLLARFGSVRDLRGRTPEDLAAVPGISLRLARTIVEELDRLAREAEPDFEGDTSRGSL